MAKVPVASKSTKKRVVKRAPKKSTVKKSTAKPKDKKVERKSKASKQLNAKKTTKVPTKTRKKNVSKNPAQVAFSKQSKKTSAKSTQSLRNNKKQSGKSSGIGMVALLLKSPVRVSPLQINTAATQTARYSGLFFIILGAIYTVYYAQLSFSSMSQAAVVASVYNSVAAADESTTTNESDSTKTTDSNYTAIAPGSRPETSKENTVEDIGAEDENYEQPPEIPFVIKTKSVLHGEVTTLTEVESAEQVILYLHNSTTQKMHEVGTMMLTQEGVWRLVWNSKNFADGTYYLLAKAKLNGSVHKSKPSKVQIDNEAVVDATTDVQTVESVSSQNTQIKSNFDSANDSSSDAKLPVLKIKDDFSGVVTDRVNIMATVEVASSVQYFIMNNMSAVSQYIGTAKKFDKTLWKYSWVTTNTPNGKYRLYAKANTPYGVVESDKIDITIKNVVADNYTDEQKDAIDTIKTLAKEPVDPISDSTQQNIAESIDPVDKTEIAEPSDTFKPKRYLTLESAAHTSLLPIIEGHEALLQDRLDLLTVAYRANNTEVIDEQTAYLRDLLIKVYAQSDTVDTPETEITLFRNQVDKMLEDHKSQVEQVDKLLTDRKALFALDDSDKDGISNYDEVTIYNTNPFSADTDNDGYADGAEVLAGFDPTDDTPESVIEYQSPKEKGVIRSDILQVASVVSANNSDLNTSAATSSASSTAITAVLTGKALPNSFVSIYIFSTPVVVTVRTNDDGSWRYEFDKELEDGEHSVYVGMTDNAGKLIAKSEPFKFIKEARAITPVEAAALTTQAPEPSFLSHYMLMTIASISVVAIGLVLVLLGLHLDGRRRFLITDEVVSA